MIGGIASVIHSEAFHLVGSPATYRSLSTKMAVVNGLILKSWIVPYTDSGRKRHSEASDNVPYQGVDRLNEVRQFRASRLSALTKNWPLPMRPATL
jgi:hypothetical protein